MSIWSNLKSTAMKFYLTLIAACICLAVVAQPENASRRRNFNTGNDIAMKEFDPVSYFQNKPTKGDPKFQYEPKELPITSPVKPIGMSLRRHPTNMNQPMGAGVRIP